MGLLRLYLALCVVAAHSNRLVPWDLHTGKEAVQIFYIISGFYMALILSGRYARAQDFYLSRFLRIFPLYWVVCAGTLLWSLGVGALFGHWLALEPYVNRPLEHNGSAGILFTAITNVTLFGQDLVMFLSQDRGQSLHWTADFGADASPLWNYLLLPQCWSVELEVYFYLLAPFLNRLSTPWLAVIAGVPMLIRIYAYLRLALAHDPWDYRFFPFEISLFILGMLTYRLYLRVKDRLPKQARINGWKPYAIYSVVVLVAFCLHAQLTVHLYRITGAHLGMLLTYPIWALAIIPLFWISGSYGVDRLVGELSFPVYLIHRIIAQILHEYLSGPAEMFVGISAAILSIGLGLVLYRVLVHPIDRLRYSLAFGKPESLERQPAAAR